ncbi:MAG TPA: ABC transporter ATP-binding protein [bacterium]|jgi:ATP-binding cassette subfamily B protein
MWWHIDETDEGVRKQSVFVLLRKVIPLFGPHKKLLYFALLLLIPITAAFLAPLFILEFLINEIISTKNLSILYLWTGLLVGIVSVGSLLSYIQAITLFKLGITIITDLKGRLFEHVLHLGLDFHEDHSPGKLISRVESDTETLRELFGDVAVNLTKNSLFFIGLLGALIYRNFAIAAWILGLSPILFAAIFWFLNFMRKYWREWRVQWAIVTGYVTEYVQGIDVIQMFNYQDTARKRMNEVNMGKFRIEVPTFFLDYGFWGVFWFGEIIAICAIVYIGYGQLVAGTLAIGTFVMFIEAIRQMYQPMIQLSEQLNFVNRALISVERVLGILETERSVQDGDASPDNLTFNHRIEFENVWFAYDKKENWILKDLSFTIEKGEKVALVGQSGGGKSTIVNLLLRFYDPQKGSIKVDGIDIRDFPVKVWRDKIGLVLQDIFLFPGSVADNIRIFDQSIPVEKVKEVAKIAHADQIIEKLPDKYDGELAERGANLSVGERQLMSFARALTFDPPLLVLDEATSSVDPYTERLVQEALERLLAGRTAVIVAHRLSTILNADKILLIQGGEILESGNHEQLLDKNGIYAKLFRLQFEEVSGAGKSVGGAA